MHYTTQQLKCIVATCKKIPQRRLWTFRVVSLWNVREVCHSNHFKGLFWNNANSDWAVCWVTHPNRGIKLLWEEENISPLEWHTRNSVEVTFDYKALATTLGLEKANTPVMFVVPWRASCMQNKYILCFKWYSIFFSSLETCHACDLCSVIFIRPTSL